jgi:methyl-galactoside transport system substrate-binding protein
MTFREMRRRTAAGLLAAAAAALVAAALSASCSKRRESKPHIGVVLRSFDDHFSSAVKKALIQTAGGRAGLEFADSRLSAVEQLSWVEVFAERRTQTIIVDPVDALSARSAIAAAKAKDVPVVFIGERPSAEAISSWDKAFYVGSKDFEIGAVMAGILAEHWKKHQSADIDKDGILQYILLTADRATGGVKDRVSGIKTTLAGSGLRSRCLAEEMTDTRGSEARAKAAEALHRYGPRIEAFVCTDWDITLQAVEACEAAGGFQNLTPPIVGFCSSASSPRLKAALASGGLIGAACMDTEAVAAAALELSLSLAEGENPPSSGEVQGDAKYSWIPFVKTTKEEAALIR